MAQVLQGSHVARNHATMAYCQVLLGSIVGVLFGAFWSHCTWSNLESPGLLQHSDAAALLQQ